FSHNFAVQDAAVLFLLFSIGDPPFLSALLFHGTHGYAAVFHDPSEFPAMYRCKYHPSEYDPNKNGVYEIRQRQQKTIYALLQLNSCRQTTLPDADSLPFG